MARFWWHGWRALTQRFHPKKTSLRQAFSPVSAGSFSPLQESFWKKSRQRGTAFRHGEITTEAESKCGEKQGMCVSFRAERARRPRAHPAAPEGGQRWERLLPNLPCALVNRSHLHEG